MLWLIVLNTMMNDGTLYTDIRTPNKPEFNNEQSCKEAGQILVDQLQLEVGTNAGRTYYICKAIPFEDITAAIGKGGSGT
jgi:hypothetical protein